MSTQFSQTVFSPWLTPVRVVATLDVVGVYLNGPNNNGVGATLVVSTPLTIDGVVCNLGDRVLLANQASSFQNGVYIVENISSSVTLQRAADQQSLEQIQVGQYMSVAAGSVNAGVIYSTVEPKPQQLGVSPILFRPSGPAGVFKVTATFTPTQLMSMYATPILILPPPGVKQSLFNLITIGAYDYVTTPYNANAGKLVLQFGNAPFGAGTHAAEIDFTGFTDQVVSTLGFGNQGGSSIVSVTENQPIYLTNTVAPLSGGDGLVTLNMLFTNLVV